MVRGQGFYGCQGTTVIPQIAIGIVLDEQNIVIAFPQCDVLLKNDGADRIAS